MPGYEDFVATEKTVDDKAADEWILEALGVDDTELEVDVKLIYIITGEEGEITESSFRILSVIVVLAVLALAIVIYVLYRVVYQKCCKSRPVQKHMEHVGPLRSLSVTTKSKVNNVDRFDVEA